MESSWYAYQCNSGNTLFFYNTESEEYRWLSCSCKCAEGFGVTCEYAEKELSHKTTKRRKLSTRSIATGTDFIPPLSIKKVLKTQGTQTDLNDLYSSTKLNTVDVISIVESSDNDEEVSPKNTLNHSSLSECTPVDTSIPAVPRQPTTTGSKVKLLECSFCDKAFTSHAFLIKHEKYHIFNGSKVKKLPKTKDSAENIMQDGRAEDVPMISEPEPLMELERASEALPLCCGSPTPDSVNLPHLCIQCNKTFEELNDFETHFQKHFNERFCNACQRRFKHKDKLKKHLKRHLISRHLCTHCKRKFVFKVTLKEHLKVVHKVVEEDNPPDECDKSLTQYKDLSPRQDRLAITNSSYQCDKCDRFFNWYSDLVRHQKEKHIPGKEPPSTVQVEPIPTASQDGLYWCHQCNRSYINRWNLLRHQLAKNCNKSTLPNLYDQENQCHYCDKVFLQRSQLASHIVTHIMSQHSEPPFQCDQCEKKLPDIEQLEKHLRSHFYKRKEIQCEDCKMTFKQFAAYKLHAESVHGETIAFKCSVCNREFISAAALANHHYTHNKREEYPCDQCEEVFNKASTLAEHKLVHQNIQTKVVKDLGDFPCLECNRVFTNGIALANHTRLRGGMKNKSCLKVPKEGSKGIKHEHGSRKSERSNGSKEKKDSGLKPFKCYVCDKAYSRKDCLSRHKRVFNHNAGDSLLSTTKKQCLFKSNTVKKKRYRCQTCKKSFQLYSVFYRHQLIHKGKTTNLCRNCGQVFSKGKLLSSHKCKYQTSADQSAAADKESELHFCGICFKRFSSGKNLTAHSQTHMDREGHIECKTCNMVFEVKERLEKHLESETHKNEIQNRPNDGNEDDASKEHAVVKKRWLFECGKCEMVYMSRKGLRRHQLRKSHRCTTRSLLTKPSRTSLMKEKNSSRKRHRCKICSKSFRQYSNLYSHCSDVHGGKLCSVCSRTFSSFGNMKRHIFENHRTGRTFYCHTCSKEFKSYASYNNHVGKGSGSDGHKCTTCDQAFSKCVLLMEHMNTHKK